MRSTNKIGLLWDSVSDNTGDQAIGILLERALRANGLPTHIIDPFMPFHNDIAMLVVGGGELIRRPGDPFYESFRVPGNHILNTVGVLDGTMTGYLADYRLVTSRSCSDQLKLARGEVYPDLTLLLGDYLSTASAPPPVKIPDGALGIHVMPSRPDSCLDLATWLRKSGLGPIVWLPITHYANDTALMRVLAGYVPGSVLLEKLSPEDIFKVIGRLRLLVTSSLHGMLFAYAQDVPFISIRQSSKLSDFLCDRHMEAHMVQTESDLPELLSNWFQTPPHMDTPRTKDQERCRELIERISICADEALSAFSPHPSISLPPASRLHYDEQMNLSRREGDFVADWVSMRLTLQSRNEKIKALQTSIADYQRMIKQMAVGSASKSELLRMKPLPDKPSGPALGSFVRELCRTAVRRLLPSSRNPPKTAAASQLFFGIEADLDTPVYVGAGVEFLLDGWCYSEKSTIRRLEVLVSGIPHRVDSHSDVRLDIFEKRVPELDPSGNCLTSGFHTMLRFRSIQKPENVALRLRAVLEDNSVAEQSVGSIQLLPGLGLQPVEARWRSASERIAICMTTFNPLPDLFRKQTDSIRSQTHDNWICVISDDGSSSLARQKMREAIDGDSRFIFIENEKRLGFYLNFERCLRFAPSDADFIALSDHDDDWFPGKLEALISEFREDTQLVYSDMHVINRAGKILSETFWITRKNNYTDLGALLFANTITGAASMIRASLLPLLLPFPKRINDAFHDHWMALTAMVKGEIRFINRPLYSYCQHNDNVHGHRNEERYPGPFRDLKALVSAGRSLARLRNAGNRILGEAVQCYPHVLHKIILARTLLLRQGLAAPAKKRVLQRIAGIDRSLMPLIIEQVRAVVSQRPSLGLEWLHLKIAAGTKLAKIYFRSQRDRLLRNRNAENAVE